MSLPVDDKTRVAQKRQRRPAKVQSVPAAQLSDLEMRTALALRRFPPDMKQEWAETMERIATNYELKAAEARPARTLRLVVGGAQ